jgi:hypothetical protein
MEKGIKLLILAIFLVTGCESIIDVKVPYEGPKLTVNGFLRPDSTIYLSLTESKFILDDSPYATVEKAKINLFEDGQDLGELISSGNGWYTSKKKPKMGKRYSIKIESSRFGTVEAESYIPERVGILDVVVSDQRVQRDYEQYHILEVKINDPVEPGNFYEVILLAGVNEKIYRNDTLVSEDVYFYNVDIAFADPALEELNSFGGATSLVFNDITFNGSNQPLKIYAKSNQLVNLQKMDGTYFSAKDKMRVVKNDVLHLTLRHTDDSYYYFRRSLNLYTKNKGNPFAEPVKVFSNVLNGHGIFAGYSSNRYLINIATLRGVTK